MDTTNTTKETTMTNTTRNIFTLHAAVVALESARAESFAALDRYAAARRAAVALPYPLTSEAWTPAHVAAWTEVLAAEVARCAAGEAHDRALARASAEGYDPIAELAGR